MPPRAPTTQLSAFETQQLERSLEELHKLHEELTARGEPVGEEGHAVAYILSINALANNPAAVGHFATASR